MQAGARTIDAYLAALGREQRAALQALRRAIHAAASDAVEYISYRLPAFRLDGRMLVWFGAEEDRPLTRIVAATNLTLDGVMQAPGRPGGAAEAAGA